MRRGRRIVSPPCGSFKSIVFFKTFKLLIKPLSDWLPWWDRFVSTSNDCCLFVIRSFACLLLLLKVTALIQWPLSTLCIQRKFPGFLVPTSSFSCCSVGMVFTQYLTKTCGVCHHCAIFPECFSNHHFCACELSSAFHVLGLRRLDFFFLMTQARIDRQSYLSLFDCRFLSDGCMHLPQVQYKMPASQH